MIKIPILLIIITLLPLTATANDTTLTLFPVQHDSVTGRHSNQRLTTLATLELSGNKDKWSAYRELYPAQQGYQGIFSFRLPANTDKNGLNSLELHANFKGHTASRQLWQWQLLDFSKNRWFTIGDNSEANSWQWSQLTFKINASVPRFVRGDGVLLVRYITRENKDASNIDFLSIQVKQTIMAASGWWRPPVNSSWQIQLHSTSASALNLNIDADIYVIDIFNYDQNTGRSIIQQLHQKGRKVVCYFSAGSYENWRKDAHKFLARPQVLGKNLRHWPGEKWLDIRRLDILGPIMSARLDYLRDAGCDGVDPDNVDGYINDHGFVNPPLSYEDQLRYNRWLVQEAHKRGLGIGLKNNLAQIPELVIDYDWAINESCYKYSECDQLSSFIAQGKPVLHIEYEYPTHTFCSYTTSLGLYSQAKDKMLTAWRQNCP